MPKFVDTRDESILPVDGKNIVLFHPHVPESAIDGIADTLRTRWIGQGPKVELFEKAFRDALGSDHHPVAVGSCTDAMHLAYVLSNLKPGDEVIVPNATFVATASSVLFAGAMPVMVDICRDTECIDPDLVEAAITPRTKGVVPVHLGGHPADLDRLQKITSDRGLCGAYNNNTLHRINVFWHFAAVEEGAGCAVITCIGIGTIRCQ